MMGYDRSPAPVRNLGDERNVAGMTALAKLLRCSPQTVQRWTKLPFDPLRLRTHPSRDDNYPIQRRDRVVAWRIRTWGAAEEKAALEVVYGWPEIAEMCDTDEQRAREMAARLRDPLPVQPTRRVNPASGRLAVWAYADAIRDWLSAATVLYVAGGPTTMEDVLPPSVVKARRRGEVARNG